MQVAAPAKVNLTLRVLGKRPDGYHELESVMRTLTLADRLTFELAAALTFTCSERWLRREDNLVFHAARLLQSLYAVPRGARIHLEKRIPTRAGLGGGSSDAAATILALDALWELRLPADELAALAAQLGSDVPFFLAAPCAVVRGRGERVTPIAGAAAGYVVLAKPSAGLATPRMYAALCAHPLPPSAEEMLPETRAMMDALAAGDLAAIADAMVNDLEAPAFRSLRELRELRRGMRDAGALGTLLCGSGAAMFGLCPDRETAERAAAALSADYPWTAVAAFRTE